MYNVDCPKINKKNCQGFTELQLSDTVLGQLVRKIVPRSPPPSPTPPQPRGGGGGSVAIGPFPGTFIFGGCADVIIGPIPQALPAILCVTLKSYSNYTRHVFQTRFQGFSLATGRNMASLRERWSMVVASRSQLISISG